MKTSARADEDTICGFDWWVGFVHPAVGIVWLVGGKKYKHLIEQLKTRFSDNKSASQAQWWAYILRISTSEGWEGSLKVEVDLSKHWVVSQGYIDRPFIQKLATQWAGKMTQWVTVLATMPGNPCSGLDGTGSSESGKWSSSLTQEPWHMFPSSKLV